MTKQDEILWEIESIQEKIDDLKHELTIAFDRYVVDIIQDEIEALEEQKQNLINISEVQ